jgi:hypothetical protein
LCERDFCGKEITAEDVDSFIWAEVIDLGIGALALSMTQYVGKERFSQQIV